VLARPKTPFPNGDETVEGLEAEGLKVMASGYCDLETGSFDPEGDLLEHVKDLEVTSIVGMVDPPRAESKSAVEAAQAAHIRVRMITGDDVVTGAAIAKQLGIPGEAILGADFAALHEQDRLDRIESIGIVGRVAPEHKVLLAETLKQKGEVVAMTGDGVNDAPAIKAADIGIAMGSGTEVAKNAGRMVLSDDNFATIVYAVEQGRKLYDNLNKYIRFVLLLLVAFVLTFLGASILNIAAGQPFTPGQVLWIHFIVNAPFGIALGFDQETPGLMRMWPRPRGDAVLTPLIIVTCRLVGLVMAIFNLSIIEVGIHQYGSVEIGSSMALVAFVLMLEVAAFESRSETASVFTVDTFNSSKMNWIAIAETAGGVLITQWDFLQRLLGTTALTAQQWALGLASAVALLALWELGKWIARRSGYGEGVEAA
jgi:Ca2+-transporting ATPase